MTATTAATLDPQALTVGDRFTVTHQDAPIVVEVLREAESCQDPFGRDMIRYWCRREDTGDKGWMIYGPGAVPLAPAPAMPDPGWGKHYGGGGPNYITPQGPVWMFRKGQRVRFYDASGTQQGPEQANVAPAVAYAHSEHWLSR
jgi:hypothetical protein